MTSVRMEADDFNVVIFRNVDIEECLVLADKLKTHLEEQRAGDFAFLVVKFTVARTEIILSSKEWRTK